MTEDNELYQMISEDMVITLIEDYKLVDGEKAKTWNNEIIELEKYEHGSYKTVTINRITGTYKYQISEKTPEETIPIPILITYYNCSEAKKKF